MAKVKYYYDSENLNRKIKVKKERNLFCHVYFKISALFGVLSFVILNTLL
jgi:hypothetical protein